MLVSLGGVLSGAARVLAPSCKIGAGVSFHLVCCCLVTKSCLTLATPRTVTCQVPVSRGFPGKNIGVGCHFLLQGIFPTQGLNPSLLNG